MHQKQKRFCSKQSLFAISYATLCNFVKSAHKGNPLESHVTTKGDHVTMKE